jgi:AbrB family looped-hinge helix DNA binding protein
MTARASIATLRVGKDGEVRLPRSLRERLDVEEGGVVDVREDEDGNLVLERLSRREALERLREWWGDALDGEDATAFIRRLRDEWPD